jgi:hypothetical protein
LPGKGRYVRIPASSKAKANRRMGLGWDENMMRDTLPGKAAEIIILRDPYSPYHGPLRNLKIGHKAMMGLMIGNDG